MENFTKKEKNKIICACVQNKEESLIELLEHWQKDVDFDALDNVLLVNREYNFQTKIHYAALFKRNYFLKDLITDVKIYHTYYDYLAILYIAINHTKSEKKRHALMLEAFAKVDERFCTNFRYELEANDVYDEFRVALMETPSTILKIKASVYLDSSINCELFKNKDYLIKAIYNSNLTSKEKIKYLLDLSRNVYLTVDEIEHLKEDLLSIAENYKKKLDEQLATIDQELVEVNQVLYDHDLTGTLRELNDKNIEVSYFKK